MAFDKKQYWKNRKAGERGQEEIFTGKIYTPDIWRIKKEKEKNVATQNDKK